MKFCDKCLTEGKHVKAFARFIVSEWHIDPDLCSKHYKEMKKLIFNVMNSFLSKKKEA
jgi:hypothetical protein